MSGVAYLLLRTARRMQLCTDEQQWHVEEVMSYACQILFEIAL